MIVGLVKLHIVEAHNVVTENYGNKRYDGFT